MFKKNSGLVQIWVRLIQQGVYQIKDIPNLSNLQEIVIEILNEKE